MSRIIEVRNVVCPQCQARKNRNSSSSQISDSSESENQIVTLIKCKNNQESQLMKSNIQKLKQQIDQLKLSNIQKDKAIAQLVNQYQSAKQVFKQSKFCFLQTRTFRKEQPIKERHKQPLRIAKKKSFEQNLSFGIKDTQGRSHQKLYQTTKVLQKEIKWMRNFIDSLIRSVEQISLQINENVFGNTTNLKQRTKLAWKFIKQLLRDYFQMYQHT